VLVVSPAAGFGAANGGTDGSTTARPTATDEVTMLAAGGAWGGAGTSLSDGAVNSRLHVMRTTDGLSTRVLITRNSQTSGLWLFERPDNIVTNWANPSYSMCTANGVLAPSATQLTYAVVGANALGVGRAVSAMSMFMTGEGVGSGTALIGQRMPAANDLSGTFPLLPIGLYSDTAANRGRHGTLSDIWWALGALPDTTTYPLDATKQFIQCGALVFPWDRSVPLFA
jgi:hypothetical protein